MESMEKKCLRKSEEIVLSSAVIKIQIFPINLLLFFVKYRVYESLINVSIFNNNDIFNNQYIAMKRIHLSLKILTIILVIIIIKSWKEIFYSSIYQAISNRQIKVMFQNRESANYHIKTQALCLLFKWQTWLFSLELVEILISDFTVLIDSFLRFVPRLFLSKRQFRRGTLPHTLRITCITRIIVVLSRFTSC